MNATGTIRCAEYQGIFILKLVGDVRLTLCTTFDAAIERIFAEGAFKEIVIDLLEATNIDSTTWGLLAKLAILSKQSAAGTPTLVVTHPDLLRLLDSMGFRQIFKVIERSLLSIDPVAELPKQHACPNTVKEKVLEAHRILMSISDANHLAFRDLVSVLERS